MKIFLSIIISLFFLINILPVNTHAQTSQTISIDTIYTANYKTGDTIKMSLIAKNFNDIGSLGFWINFNMDIVRFIGISNVYSMINGISYNCPDSTIKLSWYDSGKSGINITNTTLFNIKFIYKGGSGKIKFHTPMCRVGSFTTHKYFTVDYFDGYIVRKPFDFDLFSPSNNKLIDSTPVFSWAASKLAITYKLFIDGNLVKESISTSAFEFADKDHLTPGPHSWYVIACNETDTTISNQTWSFYIDYTPPTNFRLISPANYTKPSPCNLLFNWHQSKDGESGLAGYQISIFNSLNSELFANVNISPNDTFYNGPSFIPSGTYYWHIRSLNNAGGFSLSNTDSFIISPNKIYSVTGHITYDNSQNTTMENAKLILKTSEGIKIDSAFTDSTGAYIFKYLDNGNYTIDIECNYPAGSINPIDALLVNRNYIKVYSFPDGIKQSAADVNGDGKINPTDALLINRYYIKIISSFKSGKWYFQKTNFIISCNNPVVNIKGICYGDVNGSYKP